MKSPRTLAQLGEFGWIHTLQKKLRIHPKRVTGIGDDTAIVPGTHKDILLTTDMILEGRHFTRHAASAYEIGRKAMAVNLSDIAAMAGTPTYALVAVGLPSDLKVAYLNEILRGMSEMAHDFGVAIVGGDTNQNDKIVICVTLIGEAEPGKAVRRCGAKKGDFIFVTGALGGSVASKKHLRFIPQIRLARELSQFVALHAMMDISDGLLSDLNHICEASKMKSVLFAPQIPLSGKSVSVTQALTEGEDFELLFTVSEKDAHKILVSRRFGSRVYPVGRVVSPGRGIQVLDAKGEVIRLKSGGFDHFKK